MKAACSKFLVACFIVGCASAVSIRPRHAKKIPSAATARALSTTRGGDITNESLVALFSGFYGLNGALVAPAPDVAGQAFNMEIKEGSLDYVLYEATASTFLGTAIMAYLATWSSVSSTSIVAFGGLACAYVTYKNQLKGLYKKLGFAKGFGAFQTIFMLTCLYLMFSGKRDTEFVAKIFATPPVLLGLLGGIAPNVAAKSMGLATPLTGPTLTFFSWFSYIMLGWGVLAQMLLARGDSIKAIGCAALVETIAMTDCLFIRKFNYNLDVSEASNYIFLAVPALTAVGLLLGEST